MTWRQTLRRALLRWDRLAVILAATLPTLALSFLGFFWLGERGLLLHFFGVCVVLAGAVALARWIARRPEPEPQISGEVPTGLSVSPNSDWLPNEVAVFQRVRARIEARTATPQPWDKMKDLAREVVEEVAAGLGGQHVLDFTAPELLLLVERTVSRYRTRMREHVPFVDSVSAETVRWIWDNRAYLNWAYFLVTTGQRVGRIAMNPPVGVMRELERVVSGGNSNWLSGQMMGVAQAVLLEEVAYAAVELYSGRLRFSDAELLDLGLAATETDRARLAQPDAPLRILFVGQTSAGKSTLVNALLGAELAETDAAATTPDFRAYETEIEGLPCFWIDSRGLDGGEAELETMLEEMRGADMIVWAVRANRPGRALDQKLLRRFRASFEAEPERYPPEIIAVATCIDRLLPGWPFPENHLPPEVQRTVGEAVHAIAADLDGLRPIPARAATPAWNVEAVQGTMAVGLGRAIKVQRSRRRVVDGAETGGLLREIGRSTQGLVFGAGTIGGHLLKRVLPASPEAAKEKG